ncbi:hypothetical protein Afil01_17690 [Actinorhabdospora filicis]|uniref:LPXTG cell wall anchor domain-containing protein n=1 Tax=Actinorhabdospora filicis TaxID=1785913 RepID=A0A9W6SJ89_9ACTN|nr:hypothetical protein [Actinorhabdospora filicis]GLZ76962.1 hypothetical protein Afil01_17690 [Actinorhabdospora filicis]
MTSPRRLSAALAALALCATAGTVIAAPAAQAASCREGGGVTVVVDNGGGAQTSCANGDPGSGLAALSSAGFGYRQNSTKLVCSINSTPGDCPDPPPTNKYWSYWYGSPGGSWTYSPKGPGTRNPKPGDVEGWAYGAGKPPSIAPPAEQPAPKPPPKTEDPKPGGDPAKPGQTATTEPGPKDPASPSSPGPSTSDAPADSAAASSSAASGEPGINADNASASSGTGTVSWILGAVAIAALAGGAVWQIRRRKTSE